MGVLSIILLVLFVIVCLLLVFLVAVQDENSVGLGGIFGGSSDSTFGSGTSSFINKATTLLAIAFIVLALVLGILNKTSSKDTVLEGVSTTTSTTTSDGNWYGDSTTVEPATK
jgi:preprotein translocase subunit SecG